MYGREERWDKECPQKYSKKRHRSFVVCCHMTFTDWREMGDVSIQRFATLFWFSLHCPWLFIHYILNSLVRCWRPEKGLVEPLNCDDLEGYVHRSRYRTQIATMVKNNHCRAAPSSSSVFQAIVNTQLLFCMLEKLLLQILCGTSTNHQP